MEDAATAEISRSQVWQWLRHEISLPDGTPVTAAMVRKIADEELGRMREEFGEEIYDGGRFDEARSLFEEVAIADDFPEFLTLPAYEHID
jgi:malate synthase